MGRRRRLRAGLAAGLVVGLLMGCTAPSPFDAGAPDRAGDAAPDEGLAPVPDGDGGDDAGPGQPDDGPDDAPRDVPRDVPRDAPDDAVPDDPQASVCSEAVVTAAGETIGGQLDALGAADFETALGFASRRFQAEVEPEIFEVIITSDYPILLQEPETAFGSCAQVADLARIEVTVTGVDGARDALVYLLVREEGRWSIDGAVSIEEPQRELV